MGFKAKELEVMSPIAYHKRIPINPRDEKDAPVKSIFPRPYAFLMK